MTATSDTMSTGPEVTPNFKTYGPLKKPKRMKRAGKKMARDRDELEAVTPELLARSNGRCEAKFSDRCRTYGTMKHHVVQRSVGGSNDLDNLKWVCAPCHGAIHADEPAAHEAGLLKRSTDR